MAPQPRPFAFGELAEMRLAYRTGATLRSLKKKYRRADAFLYAALGLQVKNSEKSRKGQNAFEYCLAQAKETWPTKSPRRAKSSRLNLDVANAAVAAALESVEKPHGELEGLLAEFRRVIREACPGVQKLSFDFNTGETEVVVTATLHFETRS